MPRAFLKMLPGVLLVIACSGVATAYDNLFICSTATNEVYRYRVQPGGAPILDLTLTGNMDRPSYLALNPSGSELFVVNRANSAGGAGFITRFLDPNGSPTANGVIADLNGVPGFDFSLPHGIAFRPAEMFVVNSNAENVLRFSFNGAGVASSSGIISPGTTGHNLRGIVVAPSGVMFLTLANKTSQQVLEFSTPGSNDHGMAFSPWGELFITEANTRSIARVLFDVDGVPHSNGQITGNGLLSPTDLTFSGWGELFVTNSLGGAVCRWTFTPAHVAVENGSFMAPEPVTGIRFGTQSITGVEEEAFTGMRTTVPYPNPTSRGARIGLELSERARVSADVFDCTGKAVRSLLSEADLTAGPHTLFWDGSDLRGNRARPGVYFVRFRAARRSWSERIAVVR
jgi:hypothetical protein